MHQINSVLIILNFTLSTTSLPGYPGTLGTTGTDTSGTPVTFGTPGSPCTLSTPGSPSTPKTSVTLVLLVLLNSSVLRNANVIFQRCLCTEGEKEGFEGRHIVSYFHDVLKHLTFSACFLS